MPVSIARALKYRNRWTVHEMPLHADFSAQSLHAQRARLDQFWQQHLKNMDFMKSDTQRDDSRHQGEARLEQLVRLTLRPSVHEIVPELKNSLSPQGCRSSWQENEQKSVSIIS